MQIKSGKIYLSPLFNFFSSEYTLWPDEVKMNLWSANLFPITVSTPYRSMATVG